MKFTLHALLTLLFFCPTVAVLPAWGTDEEVIRAFGLEDYSEDEILTTPRSPRPASLIAENVTVVTADDISHLNARTLDEVMQTVSGIQLLQIRTPGSTALFSINGSLSNNIMVLIDGIPQNLLGAEDSAELGMIPVQRIERIEIIKGAASVAWGSALGGVINIITREPETDAKLSGNASASLGKNSTTNLQGGISGTIDRLGYYIDGGGFYSKGLLPNNRVTFDHTFAKLTYDLPGKGRLTFGADYRDGDRVKGNGDRMAGLGDTLIKSGSRYTSAYLRLDYPLQNHFNLELFSSAGQKDIWQKFVYPGPLLIFDAQNRTDTQQASAKLNWHSNNANLTTGLEYLRDNIRVSEPKMQYPFLNFSRNLERYGAHLNGSYSLGPVTVLSGVRFDQIGSNDQITSYHLGATWQLMENTLLRVYAARGYSLPMINFKDSLQNIQTVQVGIESSAIPLLWLKGTLFYSNTWNIQTYIVPPDYPASTVNTYQSKEYRQGFEFEGRTATWHDLSFSAGFMYSDARDKKTNVPINLIPISVTKFSFQYANNEFGLRAILAGSHVNWPSATGNSVHDRQIVWDLHISQELPVLGDVTPEFFFSGRNLFNNAQYIDDFCKNTPSWFEVGIRFKF